MQYITSIMNLKTPEKGFDIEDVLSKLNIDEKIALLSGLTRLFSAPLLV